ncbi:MAG: TatD family hydrolase [bacterium]|nr:TatD family hydrolase [bacterium]
MIDSHSHIYMDRYDDDRNAVIARAVATGVTQLLQVGCDLESSHTVVALSQRVSGVYASVGVHPHHAITLNTDILDALAALLQHAKVVAWGEIGLDFYYDNSPRDIQLAAFEAQLQRAIRCDVPVVVHTREAETETLDLLRRYPLRRGGHVHCFTGTPGMAEELIEMGFHIGFTGIISFNKADNVRAALRLVPLERLLIETDSPYLAPQPHRGKRNEPAFVAHVAETIAEVKSVSLIDILHHSTQNFYRLYGRQDMRWEPLLAPEDDVTV